MGIVDEALGTSEPSGKMSIVDEALATGRAKKYGGGKKAPYSATRSMVDVLTEPAKIAAEAVTAPVNALLKFGKGGGAVLRGLRRGEGLKQAVSGGWEKYKPDVLESPLPPSKTGQFLAQNVIQPGVNMLSKAIGRPELVQGGAEIAGDVASLFGIKPGLKSITGTGKNILKSVADTQLPEKLYSSAVKLPLSRAWTKQIGEEGMTKRKMAVKAGLEGKVPPSEVGIAKAKNLEKRYRGVVDSAVSELDKTGRLIPKERLREGLTEAYKVAGTEGTEAAERIVNSLYGKRFEKMGREVKIGEREIPAQPAQYKTGEMGEKVLVSPEIPARTEPIMERQYKPSEIQQIKRHLYKMENYERQKLSRGLASQLKELGNKGMAHEAKTALEEMNPELKAMNQKDAAYINLVEALERAVPRIQNRDMAGLGFKILLTGSRPGMAILELISGAPRVKAATAIALNKARKIQKTPVGKDAAKAAGVGIAKTATTPPIEEKPDWQEIGTEE